MKRFAKALALTAVLSVAAFGGDMSTVDSPAPAPSGTPQGMSAAVSSGPTSRAPGDMHGSDLAGPFLDSSLSAFLTVLGLVV